MRVILIIFTILLTALIATVASDRPAPPAELNIIYRQDLFTLDPQRMSYTQDLRMCYSIYEGLVRWDNETFNILPAVARTWDISEDRLVYTFHLTDQARWSNGDPVTSHDFAYSWQRALMPETSADYTTLFFRIAGANEFFKWRSEQLAEYSQRPATEQNRAAAEQLREEANQKFREIVGIQPLDDHTLQVTLARPTPYFLDLCAFGPFYPVHRETVETYVNVDPQSGAIQQQHGWTKPGKIVCNGPYIPTIWRYNRELRLEINPEYWMPEMVRAKSIKIVPIEEPNTSVLAYETGSMDWHTDITVDYLADMLNAKAKGEYDDIHAFSTFGTYFWSFNCTPRLSDGRTNPFHDPLVRRAFAMTVDKEQIVNNVKRSGEKIANVLIPPDSIPNFTSPEGTKRDVELARALMLRAGWADRDGDGLLENESGQQFPVVELLCSSGAYHDEVALAMARMWEEAFGLKFKIVQKESKVYKDDLKRKDYMLARGGWFGDYGDPTTFLDLHKTGDGNNDRGYSDPKFDAMLEAADAEIDPIARLKILEEAERYTMEETLPVIPIWHYNYYYMFKPPTDDQGNPNPGGLKGISYHPRLVQYFWKLEVVE